MNTITQRFEIGDAVTLTQDALDNYSPSFTSGNVFRITHVATNIKQHPGYDDATNDALYDVEHVHTNCSVGNSFYDYELEPVFEDAEIDHEAIAIRKGMTELSNAVGRAVSKQEYDCVHKATRLGLESEVLIQSCKVNRTITMIHDARDKMHRINSNAADLADKVLVELLNSLSS